MGGPPQPGPQGPGGGVEQREVRALTLALELLKVALSSEDSQQDRAVIATCVANLQKVLANEEKESHGMMQGKMSPKAMSKAYGQQ